MVSSFWYAMGDCMAFRKSRCVWSICRRFCNHSVRDSGLCAWHTNHSGDLLGSVDLIIKDPSDESSDELLLDDPCLSSSVILFTCKNINTLHKFLLSQRANVVSILHYQSDQYFPNKVFYNYWPSLNHIKKVLVSQIYFYFINYEMSYV